MNILLSILLIFLLPLTSFGLVKSWKSQLPQNSIFVASEEMLDRVDFWTKIYSYYGTEQGVFHLIDDPSFILGEIDLTEIMSKSFLNDQLKAKLVNQYIEQKRTELIKKWKIKDSKKVRLQMGLKERMQKALFLSGRYLPMMEDIFQKQGLPVELTRLVFVESSFNVFAQSKVGASGLWQIMPSVAKPYGYITANYDKRNHPAYATKLAASILSQNFKNLQSWPLAITAYNHGLTGVKKMVYRADSDILEDLIANENPTASWGFASKNFYACFLAVLNVERNAHSYFGTDLLLSTQLKYKEFKLEKSASQKKLLKLFNGSLTRFRQMNPHINWARFNRNKKLPAGVPLVIPQENSFLISKI